MEIILEIINSFTKITGIKINTNKTDLLVINSSMNIQQEVHFSTQKIVTPQQH